MAWVAHIEPRATAGSSVAVTVTLDGVEIGRSDAEAGEYECLGLTEPMRGLESGTYEFIVLVDGQAAARGTLIAR